MPAELWWTVEVAKMPPIDPSYTHLSDNLSFAAFLDAWEYYKPNIETALCVNFINRLDEESITMLRLCCLGALYYLAKRALSIGVWTPAMYEMRYQEFLDRADQETRDIDIRLNGMRWKEVWKST